MSEKSIEYSEYEGNPEEQMLHDEVVGDTCCFDFLDAYLTEIGRKDFEGEDDL